MNIYLVGGAGAGKTFLGQYLIKHFDYIQAKVANPVYAIAINYLGMSPDPEKKDRPLLQYVGTEIGRKQVDNDIWVHRFTDDIWIAQQTAKDLYNKELKFVSDDVRFKNEHLAFKEAGWVGIYLDVSPEIRLARLKGRDGDAQEGSLDHESETALNEFKDELIQVDASGTLEQSYENLEQTLEYIRKELIK